MEITYQCPKCGTQTFGTSQRGCGVTINCPKCLKLGMVVVMFESNNQTYQNIGDGMFQKRKI